VEKSDLIGIAIQGAGTVSTEHLKAYLRNPHCRVVAIGSRTKEGAAARARQVGLDPDQIGIYDDYQALLAHPGLDALSICTPAGRHAQETIAAARAGKHILIEKPVATTVEDLRAMDAAVREAGVRTVVGFVLRWNPLVVTAKALVEDGALGRVLHIQTDYWHNAEQSGYPGAKGRLTRATMSAMVGGGCHAVDMARYLMASDIVEVSALDFTATDGITAPANQVALVRFANGMAGKVSACTEQWMPYQFNVDILGTDGALRDNRFFSRKLPGATDWATFPTVLPNSGLVAHHPFGAEIDHFVECVRTGVESHVNLRDAVNTHEVCFAVDQSGRENGRSVALPLLP
jgi:predicted dehydrogenase